MARRRFPGTRFALRHAAGQPRPGHLKDRCPVPAADSARRARDTARRSVRGRCIVSAAVAAGWLLAAAAAQAQSIVPSGAFVQFGAGSKTRSLVVGATWDWQRQWRFERGTLGGYWELALGNWQSEAGRSDAWLTQLGITPVFRFRPEGSAWFFEGAIGINLLTPKYHSSEKRFSTRLNFGDHLAVGRSFGAGARQELSLRLEHYSNGGIRRPNPGENFVQLRYARRF
jgi:hypothetical protein